MDTKTIMQFTAVYLAHSGRFADVDASVAHLRAKDSGGIFFGWSGLNARTVCGEHLDKFRTASPNQCTLCDKCLKGAQKAASKAKKQLHIIGLTNDYTPPKTQEEAHAIGAETARKQADGTWKENPTWKRIIE